jgi:hypothetical protein
MPTVLPNGRNPKWTRDELILALDLYLRTHPDPPDKTSKQVSELIAERDSGRRRYRTGSPRGRRVGSTGACCTPKEKPRPPRRVDGT